MGLTFTSQPGLAGTYTLTVTAVSTAVSSGDTATASASLPVTVNAAVPSPLTVTDFRINQGDAQRSSINVLQVRFNQDVIVDDMPNDVRVTSVDGDVINVPPERYSYDPTTFTVSVDVSGLVPQDGEYFLQIRADAVSAANHRAVTLSSGSSLPLLDGYFPLLFYHLTADFDGNNYVDYADYDLWEAHNGSLAGDPRYNAVYDLDTNGVIDRFDYALWRQHLGTTTDTIAPATGALVVPSDGPNPFGGATYKSDANLSLFALDDSGVTSATLQFDSATPIDLLSHLDANGLLNMPLSDVATLAGGTLSQGEHTITLHATDTFGNVQVPFVLSFSIKDTPPPVPSQPVVVLADGSMQSGGTFASKTMTVSVTDTVETIITLYRNDPGGPVEIGKGLAEPNEPAQFPIDLSLLVDATYTFSATAQDLVGNVSASSTTLTITVDSTPPVVDSFGLSPDSVAPGADDNTTTLAAVHLVGHAEPGASVTLLTTGETVAADGVGDFEFTNVPVGYGITTFKIAVADLFDNTTTVQTSVIRPVPSATPPQVAAALQNDTGSSSADGITSDPTIVGAIQDVAAATSLLVTVDTQPMVDLSGSLSGATFTLNAADLAQAYGGALPDGDHAIVIRVVDEYGNTSSPVHLSFTLQTATPVAPSQPQLAASSDTGSSSGDGLTRLSDVSVTLTAPPAVTVEISVDGQVAAQVPSNGSASATLTDLAAGTHMVTAVSVDTAGNRSAASAPLNFTVDLTSPTVPSFNITASSPDANTVTVAGTTDPLADIVLARGALPNIPVAVTQADAAGNFTLTGIPVATGFNTFIVTATSAAGNTSSATGSYTSLAPDTSPPQIALRLANETGGNGVTSDPAVTGTVIAAGRIVDFRVSVNGSPLVGALGALSGGRFTLSRSVLESIVGGPLTDGSVNVRAVATSSSGVASSSVELSFTLDTTRPPTPDALSIEAAPLGSGGFITNVSMLTINTGLSATTAEVVLYANGIEIARQTGAEPLQFQVTPAEGQVEYVAQAVDAAGNVSFFTAPIDVTFDRTMPPPSVTLDPSSANANFGAGAHTTLNQVILDGTAKPGATVSLLGTPLITTASARADSP